MSTRTTRIEPTRIGARAVVAAGDVVAMSTFVAYGLLSHEINPIEFPVHATVTLFPFLLAWTIVAPIGGLYRNRTLGSVRSTLFRTTVVWTGVTLIGGWIRSTSLFAGEAPPIFLLTTFAFGLAFVLPWRVATAVIRTRFRGRR